MSHIEWALKKIQDAKTIADIKTVVGEIDAHYVNGDVNFEDKDFAKIAHAVVDQVRKCKLATNEVNYEKISPQSV